MEQAIFLTEKQVDELTGISRGCTLHRGTKMERKVMKYDLQVSHLRTTGLAFFINARGRPIVTSAAANSTITMIRVACRVRKSRLATTLFRRFGNGLSLRLKQNHAPLL